MNLKMKIILALIIGVLNFSCGDEALFFHATDNLNVMEVKQQSVSSMKNENRLNVDGSICSEKYISMNGHQTVLK